MFFPLGPKQERLLKLFLFNFVLGFLAKSKEKINKRHTGWKRSDKTVSIVYSEYSTEFTKKGS